MIGVVTTCERCGAGVLSDDQFCLSCGKDLWASVPSWTPGPPSVIVATGRQRRRRAGDTDLTVRLVWWFLIALNALILVSIPVMLLTIIREAFR